MVDTNRLPIEFRRHIKPIAADVLHEIDPTVIFMDVDALEAERTAIVEALPNAVCGPRPTLSMHEGLALSQVFVSKVVGCVAPETVDALRCRLAQLPNRQTQQLEHRLRQLQRAFQLIPYYHGRDFDPTRALAVQPQWHKRWEALIGGMVYPAYVACLDVNQL